MKKTIYYSIAAIAAILAFSSCKKEYVADTAATQEGPLVTFKIEQEPFDDDTRVLLNGLKFNWEAGDKIYINSSDHRNGSSNTSGQPGYYYSRAPKEFVAQGTGSAVEFKGNDMATTADATHFAIYPYSKALNLKADNAKNYIPFFPYQQAVADSLPRFIYYPEEDSDVTSGIKINGQKMAIFYGREQARKEGESIGKISMKCMNAYLKFRFASSDIKELHIISPNSIYIAAEKVMFKTTGYEKSNPPINPPTDEIEPTHLTQQAGYCGAYSLVIIPENGTFEAGKDYYAAILPFTDGNGVLTTEKLTVMMYRTDGKYASKTSSAKKEIVSNKVYNLGGDSNLDELSGLSWKTTPTEDRVIALDFTQGISNLNLYSDSGCTQRITGNINQEATTSKSSEVSYYILDGTDKLKTQWVANKGATSSIKVDDAKAEINTTSATCIFQIPYMNGYTIKKVDVELDNFGGSAAGGYLSANKDNMVRITASGNSNLKEGDKNINLVTQNVAPASRYFLIFKSGSTYTVKKITFTYAPGSWHGSWE